MRHAQYRQELADAIGKATGRTPAQERRNPNAAPPLVTVIWSGSQRQAGQGWMHTYEVEMVGAGIGLEFDTLIERVAAGMASWRPSTSAARPSGPRVDVIGPVALGDPPTGYPTAVASTVVNEPND